MAADDALLARSPPTEQSQGQAAAWLRRHDFAAWEVVVLAAGIAAAVAALVVTVRADFLAYPGWLAVQKADVILGPIGVGLYWHHRRPQSRFGPLLIAIGFVQMPYILQSSSTSVLFTIGVYWEGVIYLATLALILAFPNGRFGVADRAIFAAGALFAVVPSSLLILFSPQIFAGGSISSCKSVCPANALVVAVDPDVQTTLFDVTRYAIIAVAAATAALLVWRLVTGTPPRRRALAIGTPIALVFLLMQGLYQLTSILGVTADFTTSVRWTFVIARSALWYGFLAALVTAELFAARVLRRIVAESLRRPSLQELEQLLRGPLGDPRLQLAVRRHGGEVWLDGEGEVVAPPAPGSGRTLTEVVHEGAPAAAIVHDDELSEDPELLQAAGATALLALENAELQEAWEASLRELRTSRARIAAASAHERRTLEQDLHDGAQQRLLALRINLAVATEQATNPELRRQLNELGDDLDSALDELRDLAHGIYPSVLTNLGLVYALKSVAQHSGRDVKLTAEDVGRYSPEVESAVYYSAREALQNCVKHAGPNANIAIRLRDNGEELTFEVRDDGRGFDATVRYDGDGLRNIHDRLATLDGHLSVDSSPGAGAVVTGTVPLGRDRSAPESIVRSE